MLTDLHDFYHAFMEGLMGSNKAWKFMRKAEIWRFADAQRLGRMYRIELRRLRAENARLQKALERIAKNHYECEDGFYSCPAHPGYFGNDDSRECNCWAGVARAAMEVKP